MSDRCVFVPFRDAEGYDWAEIVVPEQAMEADVRAQADAFAALSGPHRIYVRRRDDSRLVAFVDLGRAITYFPNPGPEDSLGGANGDR